MFWVETISFSFHRCPYCSKLTKCAASLALSIIWMLSMMIDKYLIHYKQPIHTILIEEQLQFMIHLMMYIVIHQWSDSSMFFGTPQILKHVGQQSFNWMFKQSLRITTFNYFLTTLNYLITLTSIYIQLILNKGCQGASVNASSIVLRLHHSANKKKNFYSTI